MIRRDFHGWPLVDTLEEIHSIVGEVRIQGESEEFEFITGHGIIKPEARTVLESYGIKIFSPLSSPTIRGTIE